MMDPTVDQQPARVMRAEARERLAAQPMLPGLQWQLDPTEEALEGSKWRTELPTPFCVALGRRLLLAELEFSEWVLRRVEKVAFERDRSVSRAITIDLLVREDAPVFVDRDGRRHWLIPLSMMRRRTLVNLGLRDERGGVLTTPGIRLTQRFDESLLLAAAAAITAPCELAHDSYIAGFIRRFIAGDRAEVAECMRLITSVSPHADPHGLGALADDPLFMSTLHRLQRSFTLFLLLPVELGRHRLLRMSFDEPTDWRYQRPALEPLDPGPDALWQYHAPRPVSWRERSHIAAAFGLRPTRIRFEVPSAERAASYHFEATAPTGVRIVGASLLAGRPNDPRRHVSVDRVVGHAPTVGLHAIEVPNGSSCRVQLDLSVPTRGWLTIMLLSSWLILAVVSSVGMPLLVQDTRWSVDQVTNTVLVLVTISAGVAALVAQKEFAGVAARLVTRLRAAGAVVTTLPVAEAGLLVYTAREGGEQPQPGQRVALLSILLLAACVVALITTAWLRSWAAERREVLRSPWDMTVDDDADDVPTDFLSAIHHYEFDSAAVGIRSAEAWHERYGWTDRKQLDAVVGLRSVADPIARTRTTSPGTHEPAPTGERRVLPVRSSGERHSCWIPAS